jgi:leucyl-tRNA synthetase
MSKSRPDSVVNPDDWVDRVGADSVRAFLMFMGPWEQGGPWSSAGINGVFKWLNRVWTVVTEAPTRKGAPEPGDARALRRKTHQTIQRVTDDMEKFRFNTSIAALMELTNVLMSARETSLYGTAAWKEAVDALVLMLAPACPHIAEELWAKTGHAYSVHQQKWPSFDPALTAEDTITLVVQVGGKVRDKLEVPASITEAEAIRLALASDKVARWIEGKQTSAIYVPGRLVNIVAR